MNRINGVMNGTIFMGKQDKQKIRPLPDRKIVCPNHPYNHLPNFRIYQFLTTCVSTQ
ncbi:hypothetical protein J2T02_003579 [Chitinophaga terrae (ex Kim and Jung 2007)]|nr:hypothetical protein [Chitinophaga terrae (ex Kim and Jung 2007)]